MEDLYPVLKMAYRDVKVISRKAGMYLCSDNLGDKPILYINNEVSTKGIDFVSMSLGKSWVSIFYRGGNVEIIDKQDGKVLQSFTEISYISKQNIYNDRYSTLSLSPRNDNLEKLIIIDNKNARIMSEFNNVYGRRVDKRSKYELVLRMYDDTGKAVSVGVEYSMKGVLLDNET